MPGRKTHERWDPLSEGHSAQVEKAASLLERVGSALDVGTGNGRNAIYLAEVGWWVHALDIHPPAIEQARASAERAGLDVTFFVDDARTWEPSHDFDLIICHGLLQFMRCDEAYALLARLRERTTPGGIHSLAFFSNELPIPEDLQHLVRYTFPPGEIESEYPAWEIVDQSYYTLKDEHPGDIRHTHSMGKLLLRRTPKSVS